MISRYSPREWVELKRNKGTQVSRWLAIKKLADSCGEKIPLSDKERLDQFGTRIIERLLKDGEDPYRLANKMVDTMIQAFARGYVANNVANIRLFFKINRVDIVDEEWNAKVQTPSVVREKDKGTLTGEGVKMLIAADSLEYQTLYEVMAIGGPRLHEAISIRMKDVFFKETVPNIPLIRLRTTKTGTSRDFPISQECYGLIQKLQRKKGDWPLFERLTLAGTGPGKHIHNQMRKLGLTKRAEWLRGGKEAWTVTAHNFRQFAENNIVKHWGDFEAPDVAKWLVGRKAAIGSRGAYQTIEDIAPRWKEWVEPYTRFL